MQHDALFSALSNPARRQILSMLLIEKRTAGAIAEAFDIGRPAVSEHLGILRQAGLVSETKSGRERIYALNAEPLLALNDWLQPFERYWKTQLAALCSDLEEGH
ncbi:metalloregulator ArsR/SmtB family transcription factor [Martelella sp. HB161492]|uniref:ArsR/SmtB family transcription factor n=1 Tax=Martelella sp. HB161492 TaxID=2720726 RepID=UPI001591CFB9|nr:metalloregulator ArsR/SmtB family transcription factor [Martelella sp. HB161492]